MNIDTASYGTPGIEILFAVLRCFCCLSIMFSSTGDAEACTTNHAKIRTKENRKHLKQITEHSWIQQKWRILDYNKAIINLKIWGEGDKPSPNIDENSNETQKVKSKHWRTQQRNPKGKKMDWRIRLGTIPRSWSARGCERRRRWWHWGRVPACRRSRQSEEATWLSSGRKVSSSIVP